MDSLTQPRLPIIYFSEENLKPGTSSWLSTRRDTVRALEDFGCFVAIYNKVSLELHNAIFSVSEELFDLPLDRKVLNTSDLRSHGYVGQQPIIPLYEGLGIENANTFDGAKKFTNLLWPSGNNHFCETVHTFSKLVAELDQTVMRMVCESYGIEKYFETLIGSTSYLLRLIKYRGPKENESNMGIIPHTDKSFMSILHQHEVKGLEIKTKDGQWIIIDPSPSSFIVMAGEAFMGWTNGRIEPPNHRVIMNGSKERYSLGLFSFIRDRMIEVPEELVDDEHPVKFKPFDHYKFIHFFHSAEGKKSMYPLQAYCGV